MTYKIIREKVNDKLTGVIVKSTKPFGRVNKRKKSYEGNYYAFIDVKT